MNTNPTKTWKITINEDEVFSRCTNETLYQAYSRMSENPKGDAIVIKDEDRGQFNVYLSAAVANLRMLLARYMNESSIETNLGLSFELQMHENHDNNVLPILINNCYEYVVRKVLEQWYHADFGSELSRLDILHCLHYRKNPVRRRIGPVF